MAQEISLTAALNFFKSSVTPYPIFGSISDAKFNVSGSDYIQGTVTIGTTETPIDLGQVSSPHWAWLKTLDTVNFVELYSGSGGSKFCRLYPGYAFPVPLSPLIALYGIADTAEVNLQYLIIIL